MRLFSLRSALLGAAVLSSAVVLQARAAPDKEPPPKKPEPPAKGGGDQPPVGGTVIFPLKELTEEKLRKAAADVIKASRANPLHDKFWKDLDKLVKLDPDKIVYEHDAGKPVKLVWEAEPTRALKAEERRKARGAMRNIFDHIFSGKALGGGVAPTGGGLVNKADVKELEAVARFKVGPNPGAKPKTLKPVPAKELTQEMIRDWVSEAVAASQDDPKKADFWKEVDDLLVIDPETIVYAQNKDVPGNLAWEAEPARALSSDERGKAVTDFRTVYEDAVFEYNKGLVTGDEAKALKGVTHLAVGPNPEPPTPPPPPPTPPLPTPPPPPMPPAESVDEMAKLRHELEETRQQLEKLRQDLEEKRQKEVEEKRQKEMDDLRLSVEKLRLELDDLHKQGDKREKDLDDSRLEAAKRQKDLDETRLQVEKLRLELEGLQKQRDKDLDDLHKQGEKRDKDLDDLRRDGERQQKELDDARLEAEKRLKELEETRLQVEKLRLELTDLRREGERRQREMDETRLQGEQTRRQLEETREQLERLEKRFKEPKKYIMTVQPSSMIYYDYCNMVWVQGPASVTYTPVDSTESPRPQRPASPPAIPPAGTGVRPQPPPMMPPSETGGATPPPAPPLPPVPPPANLDDGFQAARDVKAEEAERLFWVGYRSYWQGDYDKALVSFDGAIRIDDRDARFWYYKALTERVLGRFVPADAAVRRGRELHAADRAKAGLVSAALERVQGAERRFLNTPEIVVV